MKTLDIFEEAERQLSACNACRYCESFCPVWPAMERRTIFRKGDLIYLANLCHDCKACYYACPYTPPNELKINIPEILSEVRLSTYKEYAFPRNLATTFENHRKSMALVGLSSIALMVAVDLLIGDSAKLLTPHLESGSFYEVLPYLGILAAGLSLGLYVLANYFYGLLRFCSDIRGSVGSFLNLKALLWAAGDALGHSGFKGGGAGCYHEETHGSSRFLVLHAFIIYGFVSALVSTILAAIYQDVLGIMPPYSFVSLPVVFGVAGGVLMLIGASALAILQRTSDKAPTFGKMMDLDLAFLLILALASLSGFATLILRSSVLMSPVFILHIAFVLTLFITAPYGKFVHFVYRYAALLMNRVEEAESM